MLSLTELSLFALAGATLGVLYFGTLWLTVAKLSNMQNPLILLIASAVLRLSLLLGGFAVLTGMEWQRLTACIFGLISVRTIVIIWIQPSMTNGNGMIVESTGRKAS